MGLEYLGSYKAQAAAASLIAPDLPRKLDRLKPEFSATFSRLGEERPRIKASKVSDTQKAFIIKRGEAGTPVAEICRKTEMSQVTFFNWKKKYSRLSSTKMKRRREICETRVRYGYRRVHVLLDREVWGMNIKKVYRVYSKLGMQLRNKTPKRGVKAKLRHDRASAFAPGRPSTNSMIAARDSDRSRAKK